MLIESEQQYRDPTERRKLDHDAKPLPETLPRTSATLLLDFALHRPSSVKRLLYTPSLSPRTTPQRMPGCEISIDPATTEPRVDHTILPLLTTSLHLRFRPALLLNATSTLPTRTAMTSHSTRSLDSRLASHALSPSAALILHSIPPLHLRSGRRDVDGRERWVPVSLAILESFSTVLIDNVLLLGICCPAWRSIGTGQEWWVLEKSFQGYGGLGGAEVGEVACCDAAFEEVVGLLVGGCVCGGEVSVAGWHVGSYLVCRG